MIEFSSEEMSEFEPESGGKIFVSSEEVQLLLHAVESTSYKSVSMLKSELIKSVSYSTFSDMLLATFI